MPQISQEVADDVRALNTPYPEESIRSALSYKPRADDVFVVSSFPLCGAEWVQLAVYHILQERAPPTPVFERAAHLPLLEMQGAESVDIMPRPGSVRTHLPFRLVPHTDCAKYIYVARNPYDCCISLFEEVLSDKKQDFTCEAFLEFFNDFVEGNAMCGDYVVDLLSWYKRRFDDNVLFMTYEELLEDKKTSVLRIADFLDEEGEYGQKLRRNRRLLERICSQLSQERIQECMEPRCLMIEAAAITDEGKPEWARRFQLSALGSISEKPSDKKCQPEIYRKTLRLADMDVKMQERITTVAGAKCSVMSLWESD